MSEPKAKINRVRKRLTGYLREMDSDFTAGEVMRKLVDEYERCEDDYIELIQKAMNKRTDLWLDQTKRLTALLRANGVNRPMDETARIMVEGLIELGDDVFNLCPRED